MNDWMARVMQRAVPPLPLEKITAESWPECRTALTETLCREEYGIIPPVAYTWSAQETGRIDLCGSKADMVTYTLTVSLPQGEAAFPVRLVMPLSGGQHPFFVLLNFRGNVPDQYLPAEELIDRGYAVLSVDYNDISPDRDDGFADGLAALLRAAAAQAGVSADRLPGKIAVWAWAAGRMLDFALTLPGLDGARAAVIGHSRLGKTALLAGATDERFACVISNDSGCSGAALSRGKGGESVADITRVFPYWFCEHYRAYAGREAEMPFDQHWLLAASAPRLVCVGAAEEDPWADTPAQYEACKAAGPVWQKLGGRGLVSPDADCVPGDHFKDGELGFHLRAYGHYLSRTDWNAYMDFLDAKGWTE